MSDIKDNGGPAFPVPANEYKQQDQGWENYPQGMTLRDYFAGKALAGMLADSERSIKLYDSTGEDDVAVAEINAEWAYQLADSMIKERCNQ